VIEVALQQVQVVIEGPAHARVEFVQRYRSDRYRDKTRKQLLLIKQAGRWLIQQELTLEVL
jgi:uncharacterized protein YchJ